MPIRETAKRPQSGAGIFIFNTGGASSTGGVVPSQLFSRAVQTIAKQAAATIVFTRKTLRQLKRVGALPGSTMKEKQDYFRSHFDHVRMMLTREPRGHRGIMAAVVTAPVSPEGRFGLFYMDARRYPYLCGHATIGAVASLIDTGALEPGEGDTRITVDTPSGP